MHFHKNELSDIIRELPNISTFCEDKFDNIICTLGFEDRSIEIINSLMRKDLLRDTRIILIKYPTNIEENLKNYDVFKKAKTIAKDFEEIEYSRDNISTKLNNILGNSINNESVAFDISTCSSYVFYPIMFFLISKDVRLKILYTQAKIYHPTFENWEKVKKKAEKEKTLFIKSFEEAEFQSIGVEDIYNSPLFSEMNPGNHQSRLLIFPNFNPNRVNAIVEKDTEFNKTTYENRIWYIGLPPNKENKWRLEAVKETNRLNSVKKDNIVNVSTINYKDTLEKLEEMWLNNRYKYHISIGPLGSKMQHLGIFFFNYLHEDIGLWLAEPIKFQASLFSEGSASIHEIDFKETSILRGSLSKYLKFAYSF